MQLSSLKLVTVVGEPTIMEEMATRGMSLGATGYTLTETSGRGSRGVRQLVVTGAANTMKLEFVVTIDIAEQILAIVARRFFGHRACIAWMEDVQVMQGEAYLGS